MTWLTFTEYHKWPRICSVCRNHNHTLSSVMTYNSLQQWVTRRVPLMEQQRLPFRSTWIHPCFLGVGVDRSLVFYVVFCGSLFVLCELSLCCLFIFDLRLLITLLVSHFFLLKCTFYSILMKNSKIHKVWMLIIKKRKSYKQVCTFCVNKYKQNEKELQNTLMLFNVC
jgi:hypothetical protein